MISIIEHCFLSHPLFLWKLIAHSNFLYKEVNLDKNAIGEIFSQ